MDTYPHFAKYTNANINGVALPSSMKAAVFSCAGGGYTVDMFTYIPSPTGITESNRIRLNSGTYCFPLVLSGISMATGAPSVDILIAY